MKLVRDIFKTEEINAIIYLWILLNKIFSLLKARLTEFRFRYAGDCSVLIAQYCIN